MYHVITRFKWRSKPKAAFTPGHMLPDTSCIHLSPSTRISCIDDKIVASLSPVCCWIQRDATRPWHKWTVIMSPRYSLQVLQVLRTSNLYSSTYNYVSRYKLLVRDVSWCKRGISRNVANPVHRLVPCRLPLSQTLNTFTSHDPDFSKSSSRRHLSLQISLKRPPSITLVCSQF